MFVQSDVRLKPISKDRWERSRQAFPMKNNVGKSTEMLETGRFSVLYKVPTRSGHFSGFSDIIFTSKKPVRHVPTNIS